MTKVNRNCKTKFRLFDTSLWYQLLGSNFIRFHWTFLMIINCFVCFNPKKNFFSLYQHVDCQISRSYFVEMENFGLSSPAFEKFSSSRDISMDEKFFNQVFTDMPDSRSMIDLIKSFFFFQNAINRLLNLRKLHFCL